MSEELLGKIIVIIFVLVLFITDWKDTWLTGGDKKMIKKKIEKKKKIQPTGSITPLKNYFRPYNNIGVFPKPKIERNDDTK